MQSVAGLVRCNEQWIELYNRTSNTVDLTGWTIDGGIYSRLLKTGTQDGHPILTFTATSDDFAIGAPSEAYIKMIVSGLEETYPCMRKSEILDYLDMAEGVRGAMYMPAYIAEEKGYFKKRDLDSKIVTFSRSNDINALVSGDIQFDQTSPDKVIHSALGGFPVKMVMATTRGLNLALVVHPSIKSAADLRGKSVAITSFSYPSFAPESNTTSRRGCERTS